MNALIILTAIIAGGFLGILTGVALFLNREVGGCEECGKNCALINIYTGDDCEIEISEIKDDDDESDIPDKHESAE